jgi:hypothetical protein
MISPPEGEGVWRIRGRIFLRRPALGPSRVLLVQEDHVLADVQVDRRGSFAIDEVLGPGCRIEVHFPDGAAIEVGDPGW